MSGEYDEYCKKVKKYFPADISGFEDVEYEYSHEYFVNHDFDIVLKFKAITMSAISAWWIFLLLFVTSWSLVIFLILMYDGFAKTVFI